MVKIENSKRTILNLAESLLQDKGFNGFSYADISSQLGVKNAAIHYHFPSKEDLACAVIQRYRERFKLWINNSRVKDLSPEEKLNWFFSIYSNFRADNGKVCLVGSLEAEFNSIPEGLRKEVEGLNKEMLVWLEATLNEGKEAGVFQFNGTPASKAALIYSSVQGALQMARALGTKKFRDVVEQNKQDVLVA
ncbi:MAG: TetR/AcrR family transcriptional regulator [Anaerolineales bacterium]|nr:TetR/AcrR family transcriptional regulator [Anaerolineales bacterium]